MEQARYFYMYAAADSQAAKINWINPGTYNATEVNSPTFTADRGFTGAARPNISIPVSTRRPRQTPKFVRNSACIFAWHVTSLNRQPASHR